ncbi:MAG: ABC transporter permease [Nitrospiraceae bacterium]|nr:ABC transporter permease [Nitrospiraceae bacterium]
MTRFIEALGSRIIRFTAVMGSMLLLFAETLKELLLPPYEIKNTFKQVMEIGVKSVPVVAITAVFTGMVLALQTFTGFKRFGAEALVGTVVSLSMTREMGPVLTGLVVAGRAGAAMAAELGTMRVTEQIDALETLATNPVKYLIVPRFVSSAIVLPSLTVIADMLGILGGYAIAVWLFGMSSALYWHRAWNYLELNDIFGGLAKSAFFGAGIAIVCCHRGFYTEGGAEGVGKATTGAVVISFMTILISDYFLTAWLLK